MVAALFVLWGSLLLFALSQSVIGLAVARFLQGVASCGVWVLGFALVADLYDGDESGLGLVMSYIFGGLSLGQLVGPPIGGWLYSAGKNWPYVFCALLVGVDLVGRLLIVEPKQTGEVGEEGREREALPEFSVHKMLQMRGLVIVCLLCLGLATVMTQLEPTLPLHFAALYDYNSAQIGTAFLAFVLPNIVGGYGLRITSMITLPIAAVALALFTIPITSLAWTISILVLNGITVGAAFAPVAPGIATSVPKEYNTMGYTLMNLVFSIGISVGPIVGAYSYEKLGWNAQQGIFTGVLVLFMPLVFWMPKVTKPEVVVSEEVGLESVSSK
ncbi:MFS general substrate transporter [Rhizoclosmatium globosum]|uniref:MFS general substrate transporter n=1 Tax=Rhizoclosmatium globosum TaxID=329046 RepID=A0A1Y2CAT2_9FUNG|nr:MFS general substrate transporter [Rhizoclosmatium globosum]|eukprot:ORY44149.1 MFS general substrate transporter [Rhizoclosmatium globosum]